MAYTPTVYVDGTAPPLSAANLNKAETGIAAASLPLVPTAVKTSAYTAVADDLVLCNPSAASFTVTLPSAPVDKTRIAVKVVIAPGTNTVTIACGGTDKFTSASGPTSAVLALLGHSMLLQYQASAGLWFTVAADLPLTQTDLRYPINSTNTTLTGAAVGSLFAATQVSGGTMTATGFLPRSAMLAVNAPADGATDVSATIQATLDTLGTYGGGNAVIPAAAGTYLIGATLYIPANVTVWAYGATIQAKAGWAGYMVSAKGQQTAVLAPTGLAATPSTTGGTLAAGTYMYQVLAVTSGGTTMSCPSVSATTTGATGSVALTWAAPTVPAGGQAITGYRVYGRTAGTIGNTLLGSPTGTSFTDTGAAGTTQAQPTTNTTFARTVGVRVFGGTWDANGSNRATVGNWVTGSWVGHGFDLQKVDNCHLRDVTVLGALKWAVAVADFANLRTDNLRFNTLSDGIHVLGPGSGWTCRDVGGTVGDDMVGISTVEWPNYAVSEGNVSNVLIENVRIDSGFSLIRMLGGTGTRLDGITIRGVRGTWTSTGAAAGIYINDDQISPGRTGTVCGHLRIEDVDATGPTSKPVVLLGATSVEQAIIRGIRAHGDDRPPVKLVSGTVTRLVVEDLEALDGTAAGSTEVLHFGSGSTTPHVDASGLRFINQANTGGTPFLVYLATGAAVGNLRLRDSTIRVAGTGGEVIRLNDTATLTVATLADIRQEGGATLVYINGPACSAPIWHLANVVCEGAQNLVKVKAAITSLALANVHSNHAAANGAVALFGTSASCVLRGSGVTSTGTQFVYKDGTQTLRVRSLVIPAAVDRLTLTAGDLADNTNSALAGGTGPVVCDGTTWKPVGRSLASGTATLVAGTVTVANTNITASSLIRLTTISGGGGVGHAYVSARTAATGFTITSTSGTDTSVVFWEIVTY